MLRKNLVATCLLVSLGILCGTTAVTADGPPKVKRASPPKWSKTVSDFFSTDVKANLSGERPNYSNVVGTTPNGSGGPATPSGDSGSSPNPLAGGFAWSKVISSDTLEGEIKSYPPQLAEAIKTPSGFKAGGAKEARKYFSMLAVSFAIISEYDGDVRWKTQAAGARELFGRAGLNCKVGTDQSFTEAKLRGEDLKAILGGDTIQAPVSVEPKIAWAKLVNRPPLMSRLELAQQNRIAVWMASKEEFSKNSEAILREAQIMAVIAEIIKKEGFEFADDNTYLGFATEMQKSALEIAEGAKSKNYDTARNANSNAAKACANCHSGYRS